MHQRIDAVFLQQRPHRNFIANVASNERVARIILQVCKILDVACVGQRVENDNTPTPRICQPVVHEVRADESGAASYEQITRFEVHPTSSSSYAANAEPVRQSKLA